MFCSVDRLNALDKFPAALIGYTQVNMICKLLVGLHGTNQTQMVCSDIFSGNPEK